MTKRRDSPIIVKVNEEIVVIKNIRVVPDTPDIEFEYEYSGNLPSDVLEEKLKEKLTNIIETMLENMINGND